MFEFTKEEMMNEKAEMQAKKMLANIMSQAVLNSPSASESQKAIVRVINKARDINEALHDKIVEKYCTPDTNVETLNKVLEYLQLVEVGIKQFVETTPFVAANTEEDE